MNAAEQMPQSGIHSAPPEAAPSISAAGASDVGKVRKRNEDSYIIAKLNRGMLIQDSNLTSQAAQWMLCADEGWLLMVADGMGGEGGGDVASRVAVQTVTNYLCNVMPWTTSSYRGAPEPSMPSIREELTAALREGDSTIRREAALPGASPRMGTTLTLAYVLWPRLYIAHVGDSSAFLIRNARPMRLTTEHTVAQQLIAQGQRDIRDSSPWHHMLWNALGAEQGIDPEVWRVSLEKNDRLLLCSDGLTNHVSDQQIAEIMAQSPTPGEACSRLVKAALEDGGSDNVTAVVGHVGA